MSEEDTSIGEDAASSGIEYGGWGLLVFFGLRKLCQIAKTNGIYAKFSSPCNLACVVDTNRGSDVFQADDDDSQEPSEDENTEESDGLEMSSPDGSDSEV